MPEFRSLFSALNSEGHHRRAARNCKSWVPAWQQVTRAAGLLSGHVSLASVLSRGVPQGHTRPHSREGAVRSLILPRSRSQAPRSYSHTAGPAWDTGVWSVRSLSAQGPRWGEAWGCGWAQSGLRAQAACLAPQPEDIRISSREHCCCC